MPPSVSNHDMWRKPIRTAAVACVVLGTNVLCGCFLLTPRPDAKAVADAQDAVYEAVVRNMVTPAEMRSGASELVFNNRVLTPIMAGSGTTSCEEQARRDLHMMQSPPPYNKLADKLYRLITRGYDDYFVRADAMQDFLKEYCTAGPLSESFHTDLPRHFIDPDAKIYMDLVPVDKHGWKSFNQLFPGATGIISFSHPGFDRKLDQAIVFAAFVCGGLCGGGTVYVLRKVHGRWKVVSTAVVWVS